MNLPLATRESIFDELFEEPAENSLRQFTELFKASKNEEAFLIYIYILNNLISIILYHI